MSSLIRLSRQTATTNATKVPATPPQASKEDSGSLTGSKSHSSSVAPVPESGDVPIPAEIVSGAPVELRHRLVRIYQSTRNTMQSGGMKGEKWRIDWDILPGAGRWQNPLIGWASSADYMQGTRLMFLSKEDAVRFAEKQVPYNQAHTAKKL
ncbi:hypothetical protein Clacol_008083 [Clathrus columnatus]|uniref:NADH dehydrogenase [ubiquinone] iron-sulfur protein 4, mitochondrial n=1 Tax=Clathrus columnatus TaxID=1419009 RepID=A0AAV5ALM0_9AGAM|nr:hypothetical protein Clacol_008083 [Clathrus columnatus]